MSSKYTKKECKNKQKIKNLTIQLKRAQIKTVKKNVVLKNQPKTEQITLKSYIKDIYDPEKSQKYGVINSQETLKSLFRRLLSFPGEKFQANLTEH